MYYLDYNATTFLLEEVKKEIEMVYDNYWANPSSQHTLGRNAFNKLEEYREKFASIIGVEPREIFFTSGGTESNNLAIKGIVSTLSKEDKIAFLSTEHASVYNTFLFLKKKGFNVIEIPVNKEGFVDFDFLKEKCYDCKFISIALANNETGTIQDIEKISDFCVNNRIILHTDAVQYFGKAGFKIKKGISLASFSAHKIYGPKGIGVLYINYGTNIDPLFEGGKQERSVRPGTYNLPLIGGFVKAAEIAMECFNDETERLRKLTSKFTELLSSKIKNIVINTPQNQESRLPNTVNVSFKGITTESLLANLDIYGVYASGGAACSSGAISGSHVLKAMGKNGLEVVSAVRFSFGRGNKIEDLEDIVDIISGEVERLRNLNS